MALFSFFKEVESMQKGPFIEIDGKLVNIEHIVLIEPFENKNQIGILLDSGDFYRANENFYTIKEVISNYYKNKEE